LKERIVEVTLLGQRLSLRTDLPEETVHQILAYLADKEREITHKRSFLPPMKVALLMLLQIGADYVKIKEELESLRQAVRERAERLEAYLKEKEVPWGVRD